MTRVELDAARCPCGKPDCGEIYLKGKCHPGSGAVVMYNQKTGILEIRCLACDAWLAKVKVAMVLN